MRSAAFVISGNRPLSVAGEQAHALPVTLDEQVVTIVLDLVCQSGPAGTLASRVGMQGSIADLRNAVNISDDAKIPNQTNKSAQ